MLVAARKSEMIIILHSSLDDCQSLDDNSDTIPVHASDSKDGNSEKSSLQTEGPQQPLLKSYNPKKFGNESFARDFNPDWYKRHPWLSYDVCSKKAKCYPCQMYMKEKDSFSFENWKKPERLAKHHKSEKHQMAMEMWMMRRANEKHNSSVLSQLNEDHKQSVKQNRDYLKVIIECLMHTAQQNIAQRGHEEERDDLNKSSDVNRGNFLELISLRCKDIPWLSSKLDQQLKKHAQWTSPAIQNELLEIIADLVKERIVNDVKSSGWYGIIMDETSDISRIEQVSLCLSYCINGIKKEAFMGFYATKSTEGEVLYELVKDTITKLNLDLKDIVGKALEALRGVFGG
jgi:hypothetical protein